MKDKNKIKKEDELKNNCNCNNPNCDCGEDCNCGEECNCNDDCKCNEDCNCNDNHNCDGDCKCEDCNCDDECDCEGCHDVSEDALGYLEIAQRIQADFENYKRRNADIQKTSFNNGVYAFVEKLLPAMDSFKQARLTIKDENALKGLEIIHTQILKAFESFKISKIECLGKPFDPHFHNAVLTDNNKDFGEDIITEELQEGFKSADKIIRHSVVKINKL